MSADIYFGPHLPGIFDFTILFEQSILSLLPTALFTILAPFRLFHLRNHEVRVRSGSLLWSKLAAVAIFLCLQIVLVVLWALPETPKTKTSIAEAVVGVVDALVIAALSYAEHRRSIQPSALLNSYLFLSIVLDIALARTFWIRHDLQAIAGVFTTALVVKSGLLILEETPKPLLVGEKNTARETIAGVVSRSLFWWLNKLFLAGSRILLGVDDLGSIDDKFDSRRLLERLEKTWNESPKTGQLALMKCTLSTYRWQFVAGILPRLLFSGFNFAQPFLINAVVDFVGEPEAEHSKNVAAGLIGATILVYVGIAISTTWYSHMTYQLLTMYRGALASLVYKKTLDLETASIKDSAPVTLMSTDIEAIVEAGVHIHDLWANFIELPIGIYLLYRQVGPPSLFILVPGFFTTLMSILISPAMGPARVKWSNAIEKRVGTVSSMLSQIKGMKMMGLTDFIHGLVQELRVNELNLSLKFRWLQIQLNTLAIISEELTPVVIILAAIFWTKGGEGLTIAEAFTSLSIISIASRPLVLLLVSVMSVFGAIGSFTRLQDFLLLEERKDGREIVSSVSPKSSHSLSGASCQLSDVQPLTDAPSPPSNIGIELSTLAHPLEATATTDSSSPILTIEDASFTIGEEVEVLKRINMTVRQSTLSAVVGRVGCGKSSLLKAITGELAKKTGRIVIHTRSVAYCDQTPWLQNISIRENIMGQSPLDEEWLATVIRACALDEDCSMFPQGDREIVGSGGVALSGGQKQRVALARSVYARTRLLVLDDVFSGLDTTTSKSVFQRLFGPNGLVRQSKSTVILATNHVNFLPAADYITLLEGGTIIRNQVTYDSVDPSVWGVLETDSNNGSDSSKPDEQVSVKRLDQIEVPAGPGRKTEEDLSRQTGDIDSYKIYLRSMGLKVIIILLTAMVAHAGMQKMPQIWLRIWTEKGTTSHRLDYMGGYLGFVFVSMALNTFVVTYYILVGVPRSAKQLHELLLKSVVRAPLYFFTTTDSGITLNRFSQDMTLIDQALPMAFVATLALTLRAITETAIIASGATYVGAVIPACFIALYFLQKYYLRTSRQMRYLDLETKSPLYTQFTETLAGLSTIRAFGWSSTFLHENHVRLDISQKPFYMMFCIQRWLQVVLDLFVAGLALVLVAFALNFSGATTKGAIGLAMVNLIGFNQTLTFVIDQWTKLETSLGAIARLKWFMNNTPNENKEMERDTPSSDWPAQGLIELQNVTASYSDDTEPVLHNISLTIKPGQKVGICGRSGSGKSSLILTLLRLLEIRSGTMRIDNLDLSTLPRQAIRSHLTTLPQDPVKLSGTVRHNLDPQGAIQADEPLEAVLRKTSIWGIISARGGLDADMDELGFSVGQQQLFCLARALLSRSSVVLLDEATSSVDRQTDEEIRRVVRDEMQSRTVVEVAHRLGVVKECDIVVVMSEGKVVEVGAPEELLGRDGSKFRELWESQGL
ncbi:Fc.00g037350.m01.CDS01 [Cosmosporella sp. VM-42]